ncbi:ComEA family DNA-binding protein [Piscinibacter sp.]|jgi:competence protein ComEA|uniref:ComEA family DNA-binding protein n=1 Tax=Piscinibacter sp. TaxID=1903157 RepID=UPI00355A1F15
MRKQLAALALSLFAAAAFAGTELNTAAQAELESIKGIGVAMSTQIVDERKTAPFSDWADVARRVKGLRGRKAAALSAQGLTVNGLPYPGDTPAR